MAHPQSGGEWIHQGAEQRSPEADPREAHICAKHHVPTVMCPSWEAVLQSSRRKHMHRTPNSAGPSTNHFLHLHIQLWSGNREATLLSEPWGIHWHPLEETWRRTETCCGSPLHPSQHLSLPLSLKVHHTWHLHRITCYSKDSNKFYRFQLKSQQTYSYLNWNPASVPEDPDLWRKERNTDKICVSLPTCTSWHVTCGCCHPCDNAGIWFTGGLDEKSVRYPKNISVYWML